MKAHCCERMKELVDSTYVQHEIDDTYWTNLIDYGHPDSGYSRMMLLRYCPCCGKGLIDIGEL